MSRILVVEDEPEISANLRHAGQLPPVLIRP
jgi:hypothetical protein